MKKKICFAALLCILLTVAAGAADAMFPVARTGADGVTTYGYLNEEGKTALPFAYAKAESFDDCGLAVVENDRGQTALIDSTGALVVGYVDSPVSVEFSKDAVAFRYSDRSVYYTLTGTEIGSYVGAEGFFENGLLLCRRVSDCIYVDTAGNQQFRTSFADAGAFANGCALVKNHEGAYLVINTDGKELYRLDSEVTPAYMTVYGDATVVLTDGENMGLYRADENRTITELVYSYISPFENGIAIVRRSGHYGTIDTAGKLRTEPTYYLLTYMGDSLYAARGESGSAAAVDADGNIAYRVTEYSGGFEELRHGVAWHGASDGSIFFFTKAGGFLSSLKNAENPEVLTANVARITQDGQVKYLNFRTGKTLYTVPNSVSLGFGLTAKTTPYEKFLGYQEDGVTEYGWNVTFPEITGMANETVQQSVNGQIRAFFLQGPQDSTAEYQSLEGGYGVSLQGSVLVVSANCISGRGKGAAVWNESIALDLRTGTRYTLDDLFSGTDYLTTLKGALPKDHATYLYVYPRVGTSGITYHYNEYENDANRAYTEEYYLGFADLTGLLNREGAFYRALQANYQNDAVTGFSDVFYHQHWAAAYIAEASAQKLMQGAKGRFRPNDSILTGETCATIARWKKLPETDTRMDGIDIGKWYAPELGAVYEAGFLEGMEEGFDPEKPISRADAVQLFANVLLADGARAPSTTKVMEILQAFSDEDTVPQNRRTAMALCVREGLIVGTDGKLLPQEGFTRAQFAKLLMLLEQ